MGSFTVRRELLGFVMDLQYGIFQVPARRVNALKQLIATIIEKRFTVSARCLSRMAGSLVSMGLALGPVVRFWTRAIYSDICQADCWDKPFLLSEESRTEERCSGGTIWIAVGIQFGPQAQRWRFLPILTQVEKAGEDMRCSFLTK